ncbi:maleylpyruvate isomerase family mycothiol-dependent enzyme [Kitasatospora sp. NBC_01287]|uniref:maleylpyruvate isomerase family mycothiol-dependent enzyme n=1 Tax=Kitasatospora sp. NBC_01287 TaxID=2903573 RepID=UPI002258221A|nr:maleylpyruvate isomerase family mycothiol-dependent enzyme [Kitasatospora sp. NBC_01287]MCX4749844.1 maleylpyruvate isomerase family mycothiol-dependent enzyme [Kitasatospora sp. NBC_01287]
MDTLDHRTLVAEEAARFAALIRGVDLATPVPGCPGWTLLELTRHAGSVQRWFAGLLNQRIQQPPARREVELDLPATVDGYPQWLLAGAAVAAEAFAGIEPETAMWAWGPDQHARFWARRMLFELLVHRADAELALGLRPEFDAAVAADGIDEFLTNLPSAGIFAPQVAQLRGTGETIGFARTDGSGSWLVRLDPDGFGLTTADPAGPADPATATVRGTAADLLLLLYGRLDRTAPAFEVGGDEELLARWFANSAF